MNIADADRLLITPALSLLVEVSGKPMDTPEARVMLIAIALQESRLSYRAQIRGPARGYWQFEQGGGVRGVLTHPASQRYAETIAERLDYEPGVSIVYEALADNDVLAASCARLLLWTDPRALPGIDDVDTAWDTYIRNWRPGKPHPDTWADMHDQAAAYVRAA